MAEATVTIDSTQRPIVLDGLRKTKYGVPFQKDTWDLFSSLILSLKLVTHKQAMGFKKYKTSFLGHEAIQSLQSLKFIRSPGDDDITNLIPLSTHTAAFPEDSAMFLMQHFLDGALIKSATVEKDGHFFKQERIYQPTAKGMYLMEVFCTSCMLDTATKAHYGMMIERNPSLHVDLFTIRRHPTTDDLIMQPPTGLWNLFRKFLGRWPNYGPKSRPRNGLVKHTGVKLLSFEGDSFKALKKQLKQDPHLLQGKISGLAAIHCVAAPRIIHWLCENTVTSCPEEAAEIAAHFVLHGLLVYIGETRNVGNNNVQTYEAAGQVTPNSFRMTTAQFHYTHDAVYAITDAGSIAAWVNSHPYPNQSNRNIDHVVQQVTALSLHPTAGPPPKDAPSDLTNAALFKTYIDDPTLLFLFREFLSEHRAEFNLALWIDVEDFKTEFKKVSKATLSEVAEPPVAGSSRIPIEHISSTLNRPHESLANMPFMIYNTYLAPSSKCRLEFDVGQDLRGELESSLRQCVETLTNNIVAAGSDTILGPPTTLEIDQLAILIWLYERIQNRVLARLADDFVPKFLKWPTYRASFMNESASIISEESNQLDETPRDISKTDSEDAPLLNTH